MNEDDIEDFSSVYMLMITVAIPNLNVNVWTQTRYLAQGNYLRSLMQAAITVQRPFELNNIAYDQIKDEISWMERANYNTAIGHNVINEYNI